MADTSNTNGLHFAFSQQVVLVPFLTLSSWPNFILSSIVVSLVCLLERWVTFSIRPAAESSRCASPVQTTLRRTTLYAIATTLRLLYMLAGMTLHLGLLVVMIATLSAGQLLIEYKESSDVRLHTTSSRDPKVYKPIPLYPNLSYPAEEDLESAPPSWSSAQWEAPYDKPRHIGSSPRNHSPLPNPQPFADHKRGGSSNTITPGSPMFHRRQSSINSLRPLRGSGANLQGRPGVSPTPNSGIRKPLFQIGSGDEGHTTTDSD